MASKANSQKALLDPGYDAERPFKEEKQTRKATVFDAVAGRISTSGFIAHEVAIASNRDTHSSSTVAAAPETVLFRKKNAPTRYVESDFYFANEQSPMANLPDSDLLKAIHCYTSDYYSRATTGNGSTDWRSMNETALLALAILLEESSRDILGQSGDMVFMEGEETRF
ncbi:hypothetical protein B0O99DRAFT_593698 [Bisporella sp. PMI_857]|nr:hypothetical protein B0O99DRAFT_593698 [Bisporella sp. PMI_857]